MNYQEIDLVILKNLISSKRYALEFIQESNEKLFSPDLWRFTKIILDYIRVYKEVPTRRIIIERNKSSKNEALTTYINQIWDFLDKIDIDEKEYKHHLEKIKNRFAEKLIYTLKDRLVNEEGNVDLKQSIGELTSTVQHIKSINQIKAYEQKSLKEGLSEFRNRYVAKQNDPNFGIGLMTGYGFFDFITGGIRENEMCIVGGDTGSGKSMILLNMAVNMWLGANSIEDEEATEFKPGNDVVYFSLEMPYEDCQDRMLARLAMVPQKSIRDAKLDDEQKRKLAKVCKFIEKYPWEMEIVDIPRGATLSQVELIYNDICAVRGRKPKVIVIDYLALMSFENKDLQDWLQLSYLSEGFHELVRTYNAVGLTATQLNRPASNKSGATDNAVGLNRLSRSALQAANANFVILIEKRSNEAEMPDMILHLAKSRRTELAKGRIYKNLACCALLNSAPDNTQMIGDDISADIDRMNI